MRNAAVLLALALLAAWSPPASAQTRVKNQKLAAKGIPRSLTAPAQTLMPNENATVRGMVQFQGTGAPYPAARIKIMLIPEGTGPRPSTAYSGTDGMYYFSIPAGTYHLQIWQREKPVRTFRIVVNQKYVNLEAITLG